VCSINLNAQTYVYTVSVTSVPNDVNGEDYKVRGSREVSDIIIPHVDAGPLENYGFQRTNILPPILTLSLHSSVMPFTYVWYI